jgi:hypothetical protein
LAGLVAARGKALVMWVVLEENLVAVEVMAQLVVE